MIIARSPLRISIGGGGTDLPSYYRRQGGFLIAMAIRRHVYVSLQRRFDPGYLLKYSQIETGTDFSQIRHPIIREALKLMAVRETDIEITSVADVPAGTGLGSSSSFTTALLRALAVFQRRYMETRNIAEMACDIEIDRLGEPIGKQDQYIAAFGGLTSFKFNSDDTVEVEALQIADFDLCRSRGKLVDVLHRSDSQRERNSEGANDKSGQLDELRCSRTSTGSAISAIGPAKRSSGGDFPTGARSCSNTGRPRSGARARCQIRKSTNGTISPCATAR